jgi:hypothetical protein
MTQVVQVMETYGPAISFYTWVFAAIHTDHSPIQRIDSRDLPQGLRADPKQHRSDTNPFGVVADFDIGHQITSMPSA